VARTWFEANVFGIINESHNTKRYFLEFKPEVDFFFKAGQFVMLELPIKKKDKNILRSYSIGTHSSGLNKIELCIVLKEDGMGTPYIFDNINIGSSLKVSGPYGHFVIPDDIDCEICLVATGTGIAPIRGMLVELLKQGYKKNITLIFGNRFQKDILYYDDFNTLEAIHKNFKFIPTLSRESEENWSGERGYVHPIYQKLFKDNKDVEYFICGFEGMVKEAKEILLEAEIDKSKIHMENYG